MEAVKFAGEELGPFHENHKSGRSTLLLGEVSSLRLTFSFDPLPDIGRLMTCAIYKGKFDESPYKDLFDPNRWVHIRETVVRACCRLNGVPHRAYLDTWCAPFMEVDGRMLMVCETERVLCDGMQSVGWCDSVTSHAEARERDGQQTRRLGRDGRAARGDSGRQRASLPYGFLVPHLKRREHAVEPTNAAQVWPRDMQVVREKDLVQHDKVSAGERA